MASAFLSAPALPAHRETYVAVTYLLNVWIMVLLPSTMPQVVSCNWMLKNCKCQQPNAGLSAPLDCSGLMRLVVDHMAGSCRVIKLAFCILLMTWPLVSGRWPWSGRPSDALNLISVAAVEKLIMANRRVKVSWIVKELQIGWESWQWQHSVKMKWNYRLCVLTCCVICFSMKCHADFKAEQWP